MKKILTVFGTRPEAAKMCPLVLELKKRSAFDTAVCLTGQHRDMVAPIMDFFNVKEDFNLDIMQKDQTLFDITERTLNGLRAVMEKFRPDIVAVHGDTTTAFAAALCAFYMNTDIAHIEAGLRTYNVRSPYPEEFNRVAIDRMSKFLFAPTMSAKENLLREGISEKDIFVVGNTAIDALRYTADPNFTNDILKKAKGKRLITITAHRRENLGAPMREMFSAILDIANNFEDTLIVYPVHKNPAVRAIANEVLGNHEHIILCEPMDAREFHSVLMNSYLTMTDSGGIQEEAPSLGCPVIVMRDTTERPEAIKAGTAVLAGTSKHDIYNAAKLILETPSLHEKMKNAKNPFGDGHTSEKIANILEKI